MENKQAMKKSDCMHRHTVLDQYAPKAMEKLDIIRQLNYACNKIIYLKTEIKKKDDLIEDLLYSIHDKVMNQEEEEPPKILSDIKNDIFELQNSVCDLLIDVSNVLEKEQNCSSSSGVENGKLSSITSDSGIIPMTKNGKISKRQMREKNLVIIFRDHNPWIINQYLENLITICKLNDIASLDPENFVWRGKSQNFVKIRTDSKTTAIKVSRAAIQLRQSCENFKTIAVRKDFTFAELKIFNELWREAIKRNNAAGYFKWVVKNFKIIENLHEDPWNYKKERPPKNSQIF